MRYDPKESYYDRLNATQRSHLNKPPHFGGHDANYTDAAKGAPESRTKEKKNKP